MKFGSVSVVTAAALLVAACGQGEDGAGTADPAERARELAQTSIIIDGHIDVPYRLEESWVDVSEATENGDFDYPRAVAGGLNAPFMSIYTPARLEAEGGSRALAERLIDLVEGIADAAPGKFAIAYSAEDIVRHFDEGRISLPLGMENGSPIEGDLANVGYFYQRGIRYITLTHSLSNHISDSSYDDNKRWDGLSDFGVEVVREMNRLGIMVDISHVSDAAFWDVMEVAGAPAIASHSSARHFTPGFERNMNDEMIKRLGQGGGVIMINYGSSFLTETANVYADIRKVAWKDYKIASSAGDGMKERVAFNAEYAIEHGPFPYASLDQTLDHFDHVVALAGVDHVGLGSDYDGVGDSLPVGLKDVASYPNLIQGLLQRGYSEEDIRKILGGNLLRVWRQVEVYAREQAATAATE
jgi:membrane dipeptidase